MPGRGFKINEAAKGGYVVYDDLGRPGDLMTLLFAGTLPECLEFVRKQFDQSVA